MKYVKTFESFLNEANGLILYHRTDDNTPMISTKKDRLIPNSLSTSPNKKGWSYWGKNLFKITMPSNIKIMNIDDDSFWTYGKEVDTPMNRGKEIYKEAMKNKVDVIYLNKVAGNPDEYVILNTNFKAEKI